MFGPRWVSVTEAPRHLSIPTPPAMRVALYRCKFKELVTSYDSDLIPARYRGATWLKF